MGKIGFAAAAVSVSLFASISAFAGDVADSWATKPPLDPQWEATSQAVLSQDLIVVADDLQASAQKLLSRRAIVALTPAEAAKYMGPPENTAPAAPAQAAGDAAPTAAPGAATPTDASASPAAPAPAQTSSAPAEPAAPAQPALKAYLVRGVLLQGAIGGFTAERKGNALWVSYNGLAASAPQPLHRALIVRLPSAPAHVYVTASFTN